MKRLMLVAALIACSDPVAPPQVKHQIQLNQVACPAGFSLQVQWAGKTDWQVTYWLADKAVAAVRNTSDTKSSGCIFKAGDNIRVNLYQFGFAGYNADEASITIR